MDWTRVTKANKCPICGHDSWCTFNENVVLCMRQASDREKTLKDGSVGWIHRLNGEQPKVWKSTPEPPKPEIDAEAMMRDFTETTRLHHLVAFANHLGVTSKSLTLLGCAWAPRHHAYAFPMRNGKNDIVGIRLRSTDGRKWAVKGSHQGVFWPLGLTDRRCYICEGPTDTAAALSMGLRAMGRPSCSGGASDIVQLLENSWAGEVVIVADNDGPGMVGARQLQKYMRLRSTILLLPCKDMRELLRKGGCKEDIDDMVDCQTWQPIPY